MIQPPCCYAADHLQLGDIVKTVHMQKILILLACKTGFIQRGYTQLRMVSAYRRSGWANCKLSCLIVHFAGTRSGTKAVLPHSECTLSYELVAISGGTLSLPDITVTAAQLNAQLQPLAGCKIFAAPAPKDAMNTADSASALAPKMAQLTVH